MTNHKKLIFFSIILCSITLQAHEIKSGEVTCSKPPIELSKLINHSAQFENKDINLNVFTIGGLKNNLLNISHKALSTISSLFPKGTLQMCKNLNTPSKIILVTGAALSFSYIIYTNTCDHQNLENVFNMQNISQALALTAPGFIKGFTSSIMKGLYKKNLSNKPIIVLSILSGSSSTSSDIITWAAHEVGEKIIRSETISKFLEKGWSKIQKPKVLGTVGITVGILGTTLYTYVSPQEFKNLIPNIIKLIEFSSEQIGSMIGSSCTSLVI